METGGGTGKAFVRRQQRLILIVTSALVLMGLALGYFSFTRFQAASMAWENHTQRATLIDTHLAVLNRHIGYGGFIHNFKNYILRRDRTRYETAIERDIQGFRNELTSLEGALRTPADRRALEQVRATFEEYAAKYQLAKPLIDAGKSREEIDAVVKVNDDPALAALAFLTARGAERARAAEETANELQHSAMRSLVLGGMVFLAAILASAAAVGLFAKRLAVAEEASRRDKQELDILVDTSPDPMLSVDTGGRILRANHMAETFFGYPGTDLLEMSVEQLIPDAQTIGLLAWRAAYLATPENVAVRREGGELRARTRDGREPIVEISLSSTGNAEAPTVTLTIRDVTEQAENRAALLTAKKTAEDALQRQQEAQTELVKAEKMAALGGLVAGVAHEVNTPIGVTLGSATHLEAETRKALALYENGEMGEEDLSDYFATASQAAQLITLNSQRAADLITSFKQVAVDQTSGERREFNLDVYLREILNSLHPALKKTQITTKIECPDDLDMKTLPGTLSQVVTNLVTNSIIHAFAPDQAGTIHISATPRGSMVELIYRDDGVGIPAALHERVFEPFYTTKRGTGGSGLGLHIIYNTVTQSLKGTIALESAEGEGTTFRIRIPRDISDQA